MDMLVKPINSEELKNVFNTFIPTKEFVAEKVEIQKSEVKPLNNSINIDEQKFWRNQEFMKLQ